MGRSWGERDYGGAGGRVDRGEGFPHGLASTNILHNIGLLKEGELTLLAGEGGGDESEF
jgi:hypothetical protein